MRSASLRHVASLATHRRSSVGQSARRPSRHPPVLPELSTAKTLHLKTNRRTAILPVNEDHQCLSEPEFLTKGGRLTWTVTSNESATGLGGSSSTSSGTGEGGLLRRSGIARTWSRGGGATYMVPFEIASPFTALAMSAAPSSMGTGRGSTCPSNEVLGVNACPWICKV